MLPSMASAQYCGNYKGRQSHLDNGFWPDDYVKINDAILTTRYGLGYRANRLGKSTTLFACLLEINKPELNILTAEDPVEYYLEGAGQVQARTNRPDVRQYITRILASRS